jgi:hypothetical protein
VEKAIQFISKYASLDIIGTNYLQKGVVMTAVSPPVETPRVCKWADNIGKSPQRIRKIAGVYVAKSGEKRGICKFS